MHPASPAVLLALQAGGLSEPWDWLLPAAISAGVPVLDPRFNHIFTAAAPTATTHTAPASSGSAAAAGGGDVIGPPGLPVDQLLGQQPVLGRPPFLGPLVRKLAAAQQHLGSLTAAAAAAGTSSAATAAAAVWDEGTWCKLFVLLADHPPRDLQPGEVSFLRSLPMFRLLQVQQPVAETAPTDPPQQQQQQEGEEDAEGWEQDDLLLQGGADAAAARAAGQCVALGDDSRWVLAPQAVVQECQGEPWP
jgi:hypothetical protein